MTDQEILRKMSEAIDKIHRGIDNLEKIEEMRGISQRTSAQASPSHQYVEQGRVDKNPPQASSHMVIPIKTGVSPHSWAQIPQLPQGASTPSGVPYKAEPTTVIGVSTTGKQSRFETAPENQRRVPPSSTVRGGPDLASVYQWAASQDPTELQQVSAGYTGPAETIPTRGGVRTLMDEVRDLTGTLQRLTGKK